MVRKDFLVAELRVKFLDRLPVFSRCSLAEGRCVRPLGPTTEAQDRIDVAVAAILHGGQGEKRPGKIGRWSPEEVPRRAENAFSQFLGDTEVSALRKIS